MDIPVYKLFLAKPNIEAMRLPPEKQQELMAFNAKNIADIGAKSLLMADIFSNEDYQWMGVEWYPNLAAAIEHTRCLREVNWLQYMAAEVFLGTEMADGGTMIDLEPQPPEAGKPPRLYKVWVARLDKRALTMEDLTPEEKEKVNAVHAQEKELGILMHVSPLVSFPYNEAWTAWGLESYPNHEAVIKDNMLKWDANWWKHSQVRSYLGIASGGVISGLP